jgi:hypothetical protein
MAMYFHDGTIYHHILKIRIFRQCLEDALESSALRPASKPLEHRVPLPKLFWQISPRRSGSRYPQHRFQKQPAVASRLSRISHFSQTIRLDCLPLLIVQYLAYQGPFSNSFFFPLPTLPHSLPLSFQPKNQRNNKRQQPLGPCIRAGLQPSRKSWLRTFGLQPLSFFWAAVGVPICNIDKANFDRTLELYLLPIQTRVANRSCHNRG